MPQKLLSLLLLGLLGAGASAQVIRCEDPKTKQVTYSNVECPGNAVVRVVEAKRSEAEIQEERLQAAAARQRLDQELARDDAQRQASQEAARQTAAAGSAPRTNSYECNLALRNAETSASSINARHSATAAADRQRAQIACYGAQNSANIEQSRAGATRITRVQNTTVTQFPAR